MQLSKLDNGINMHGATERANLLCGESQLSQASKQLFPALPSSPFAVLLTCLFWSRWSTTACPDRLTSPHAVPNPAVTNT